VLVLARNTRGLRKGAHARLLTAHKGRREVLVLARNKLRQQREVLMPARNT